MNDDFKNYIQLLIDNKDKITHLPERDIHNLLDYITNLQQENERLKINNKILKQNNINEVLRNDFDMCVKDLKKANKKIEKLENYKSRIEKAVEYIKKQTTDEDTGRDLGYSDNIDYEYLLNILNGRSDE